MQSILVNLTESELEDIIFCLDARANNEHVAEQWREEYRKLADKLKKKMV